MADIAGSEEIKQNQSKLVSSLTTVSNVLDYAGKLSRWLNITSVGIFFLMVCLTFFDVFMRYVFSSPLSGTKEHTEVLLTLLVAFSISYTYDLQKHIRVDLITSKLKGRVSMVWETITILVSTVLVGILAWQSILQTLYFIKVGKVHGTTVMISAVPFQAALVIGCVILFILLLRDCVRWVVKCIEAGLSKLLWLCILMCAIVLLAAAYVWVQPGMWDIEKSTLGIIGIIMMLVLIFSGILTGFSLMLTGFLMIGHIRGTRVAVDNLATQLFSSTSNYTWAVVGFFILMGFLCLNARFGEDVYITLQRFFGWMKGGLAKVTIGASTAMAGIVGDSMSVASTMSTVGLPQMRKYNYKDRLSIGTIAAGSTIGPLIPPSTTFIIYASLTGQSVGKLFIAGIIPGLVLATMFILTIRILCHKDPEMGPSGPTSTFKERISSLKYGGPIILLFLLVIGGIYGGIFTATEGGAIGCMGALFIGLVLRRFTWKSFTNALLEGVSVFGMIFLVIIGANVFSTFLAWCNLSKTITDFFLSLNVGVSGLAILALMVFFVAGFFIDIMPLILIGIPIFHPIISAMGVDPIWFTVLVVMCIQVGVITPPFATILFALKGLNQDIKIETIFRGVMPFVLATALTVLLIFFIPALVTWLPGLLY